MQTETSHTYISLRPNFHTQISGNLLPLSVLFPNGILLNISFSLNQIILLIALTFSLVKVHNKGSICIYEILPLMMLRWKFLTRGKHN